MCVCLAERVSYLKPKRAVASQRQLETILIVLINYCTLSATIPILTTMLRVCVCVGADDCVCGMIVCLVQWQKLPEQLTTDDSAGEDIAAATTT